MWVIRIDRIRNDYIRGSLNIAPVTERMRSYWLSMGMLCGGMRVT
jgi:hypothetical protein